MVGRLTPCSDARSVSMRGRALNTDSRPKWAGAGSSPADRSSAAIVRITSGMISRMSRALSRAWVRVMSLAYVLGGLIVMCAKLSRGWRRVKPGVAALAGPQTVNQRPHQGIAKSLTVRELVFTMTVPLRQGA